MDIYWIVCDPNAGCWHWKAAGQETFHQSRVWVRIFILLHWVKIIVVSIFFPALFSLPVTYLRRENDFDDGNHFYRFLEHESFIPKCFNFRGSVNDCEPKSAAMIGQRLTKIMSAILESYSSHDRQHVDYVGISNSEEFRRYTWYSWFTLFHLQLHFMFQQFMEQSHSILNSDF